MFSPDSSSSSYQSQKVLWRSYALFMRGSGVGLLADPVLLTGTEDSHLGDFSKIKIPQSLFFLPKKKLVFF